MSCIYAHGHYDHNHYRNYHHYTQSPLIIVPYQVPQAVVYPTETSYPCPYGQQIYQTPNGSFFCH